MKEGWKNDLISAMKEVDHELVEEVVKGQVDDAGWRFTSLIENKFFHIWACAIVNVLSSLY